MSDSSQLPRRIVKVRGFQFLHGKGPELLLSNIHDGERFLDFPRTAIDLAGIGYPRSIRTGKRKCMIRILLVFSLLK